jgi:hypothetical protein
VEGDLSLKYFKENIKKLGHQDKLDEPASLLILDFCI